MSKESYHTELVHRLAQVDEAIGEAEAALAVGTDQERVMAAGELVVLRRERDGVAERLVRLQTAPNGAWVAVREELDALISVFQPHGHRPGTGRYPYLAALYRRRVAAARAAGETPDHA